MIYVTICRSLWFMLVRSRGRRLPLGAVWLPRLLVLASVTSLFGQDPLERKINVTTLEICNKGTVPVEVAVAERREALPLAYLWAVYTKGPVAPVAWRRYIVLSWMPTCIHRIWLHERAR